MRERRAWVGLAALVAVVALVASGCVLQGTWTTTALVDPSPQTTNTWIRDVSCASATACLAVGGDATPAGGLSWTPMVQRWDGSSWSVIGLPTFPVGATGVEPTQVSCGAATVCGVMFATQVGSSSTSRFAIWNGSTWTAVPLTGLGANGTVSCPTERVRRVGAGGCSLGRRYLDLDPAARDLRRAP